MGHRLHRPQSSQARTQADSVRGVAVGRCRGLNKAGGVTNQVTPHPIHHRAWPMSIRHDNLDRLLAISATAGSNLLPIARHYLFAEPDVTPITGTDSGNTRYQLKPPERRTETNPEMILDGLAPCFRQSAIWSTKSRGGADECHAEPRTIRVLQRLTARQIVSRGTYYRPGRP